MTRVIETDNHLCGPFDRRDAVARFREQLLAGIEESTPENFFISQIEGGLSFGLSGFPFWSQEIGGFLGQP